MLVGILGMFLAPFGMLISKWATLQAFINVNPPILALLLAFGSAPTLFFWTKWMGKIISVPQSAVRAIDRASGDEWTALGILALLTIAACGIFPLVAIKAIEPYTISIFSQSVNLTEGNIVIMAIMLGFMVLLPAGFALYPKKLIRVPSYLAGANVNGSLTYKGAMGIDREIGLRNYYLAEFLSEKKLTTAGIVTTLIIIFAMFAVFFVPCA
jgi:ech hydrogenase subunit A